MSLFVDWLIWLHLKVLRDLLLILITVRILVWRKSLSHGINDLQKKIFSVKTQKSP